MKTTFYITNIGTNIMKKISINIILFLVAIATLNSQYVMPSGGSDGYGWRVGTTQVISWSKYFMDTTKKIDILLWNGETALYTTIAEDIPITNEYYLWDIPTEQPLGGHFKIKIIYSDGFLSQFKYVSNDFFSINESVPQSSLPAPVVITKSTINTIKLYPNPASTSIEIESTGGSKFYGIDIYDATGNKVVQRRFNYINKYQLVLTDNELSTGSYTLRVRFMGAFVNEQLVISR